MKLSAIIEYFFFQDNTHPSGINVVTLKVTGMTMDQYTRLHKFMKDLVTEPGQVVSVEMPKAETKAKEK